MHVSNGVNRGHREYRGLYIKIIYVIRDKYYNGMQYTAYHVIPSDFMI